MPTTMMAPPPLPRAKCRGKRATVLLVEDQSYCVDAMVSLLQDANLRLMVATNAKRALDILKHEDVHLILLDINLPDYPGWRVLTEARTQTDAPVIIISADAGLESQSLAAGAVDFIQKGSRPAIVRARIERQLAAEHERGLSLPILTLAKIAAARDQETKEHLYRTSSLVSMIAGRLAEDGTYNFSNRAVVDLARAAPLHDVGKVGIPDRILLKPARLDAAEMAVMRTHATIGAQIIEDIAAETRSRHQFWRVAYEIARWHHERWDGNGYPDGLAGADIPVSARIMAVADVYDAITSRRPYKPAIPRAQAFEMIMADRGKHFDPAVADAFAACRKTIIGLGVTDSQAALQQHFEDPNASLAEPPSRTYRCGAAAHA